MHLQIALFLLGTTSVTPTMLRLTPSFNGDDGRFVLTLDYRIQFNLLYLKLTFKSIFNFNTYINN